MQDMLPLCTVGRPGNLGFVRRGVFAQVRHKQEDQTNVARCYRYEVATIDHSTLRKMRFGRSA